MEAKGPFIFDDGPGNESVMVFIVARPLSYCVSAISLPTGGALEVEDDLVP